MSKQQFSFAGLERNDRNAFGGSGVKSHSKLERPLAQGKWMHLTLKSEKATGKMKLNAAPHRVWIGQLLREKAAKYGIAIGDMVVAHNHVHLKVKLLNRSMFKNFLRVTMGLIARKVTGATKGKRFGRFWTGLPFTRILTSGFEALQLQFYFVANRIEQAHGYERREAYLKECNEMLARMKRKRAAS